MDEIARELLKKERLRLYYPIVEKAFKKTVKKVRANHLYDIATPDDLLELYNCVIETISSEDGVSALFLNSSSYVPGIREFIADSFEQEFQETLFYSKELEIIDVLDTVINPNAPRNKNLRDSIENSTSRYILCFDSNYKTILKSDSEISYYIKSMNNNIKKYNVNLTLNQNELFIILDKMCEYLGIEYNKKQRRKIFSLMENNLDKLIHSFIDTLGHKLEIAYCDNI